jgi:hypothetical protein
MTRVAQISKANGPFELVEREIPEPGPNTVRVAVDACAGGERSGGSGLGVEGLRTAVPSTGPLYHLCSGAHDDQANRHGRAPRAHRGVPIPTGAVLPPVALISFG